MLVKEWRSFDYLKKIIQSKREEHVQEDWTHPVFLKGLHNDSRSEGASRIDAAASVADLESTSLRTSKEKHVQNPPPPIKKKK